MKILMPLMAVIILFAVAGPVYALGTRARLIDFVVSKFQEKR